MTEATLTSVHQLLSLWHGDKDCDGFMHPELVAKVCDLMRPPPSRADDVAIRFYPAFTAAQLASDNPEAMDLIRDGFMVWERRKDKAAA
jgi:hypothetical protein